MFQGHHKTAWKQVLHEHFPEPVNATAPVPAMQGCRLEENFHQAIQLFIQQMLIKKKPRDRQYIYLQPGREPPPPLSSLSPLPPLPMPAFVSPIIGWLLHCFLPSTFFIAHCHATNNALFAGCFCCQSLSPATCAAAAAAAGLLPPPPPPP